MSSVAAIASPGRGLLRILGLAFGVAEVVGNTVGVGIMRTPGPTAGRLGDPALIYLVWLGVGLFVLMVANTLAELATAMPKAGGPYIYVRRAFGDYVGFVSGWTTVTIQVVASAYLAIASSEFLAEIWPALAGRETVIATVLIVMFAGFNSFELRASNVALQLLSLLKVSMLAALVIVAFTYSAPPLSPRILYSMSRDGLFLPSGAYVTRHGVPLPSMWLSAAGAIVIANVGVFDTLYTASAFLNACVFLLCCGALFMLRWREPALRRPYQAWGYPWVPGIVLITAAVLLVVFVLGNTRPSLLAIAVVVVTYPLFRFVQRRRRPTPGLD